MERRFMIENFSPGYMQRAMHLFPRQGDRDPWRNPQNYALDKQMIRHAPLEDGVLDFSNRLAQATPSSSNAAREAATKSAA